MNRAVVFKDSLAIGLQAERVLDSFFGKIYRSIVNVTPDMQLNGIDRIFTNEDDCIWVEYKADLKAQYSGNVFLELLHHRESDGLTWGGWGCRSKAHRLALYLPGIDDCLWVNVKRLHGMTLDWNAKYPKAIVHNQGKPGKPGFKTQGVLVPVREMRAIADHIYKIPKQ